MTAATTTPGTVDPHRLHALTLANSHSQAAPGGPQSDPASVVDRAAKYHAFLTGVAVAKAAVQTGAQGTAQSGTKATVGATGATGATGAAAPGAAVTQKSTVTTQTPPKQTAQTPGTGKTTTATGKTTTQKPDTKAGAATGKPATASQPTMKEVVDAMTGVFHRAGGGTGNGKKIAYDLLAEAGSGATSAKELKPTLYGAVIKACKDWKPELVAETQPDFSGAEDGAAAAIPDTSGAATQTPVSSDDDAIDSDPPEQTSGGSDADLM